MEVLKKKSKDKSYYQSKIKIKAIGFYNENEAVGNVTCVFMRNPRLPRKKGGYIVHLSCLIF